MENSFITHDQDIPLETNKISSVKGKAKQILAQRSPGAADNICIYRLSNGQEFVKFDLEYKPHFKFAKASIKAGLQGIIHPEQEAINQQIERFEAASKWIVSVVITQLFSI